MASTIQATLTEWLKGAGYEYLQALAGCIVSLLWSIIFACIVHESIVWTCLFVRWLRFMFGKRIAPDAAKTIIVTGATSGFGLGISKRLYKLGFTVFACYYNKQEEGYQELSNLRTKNTDKKSCLYLIKMDIRSKESIQQARKEIEALMEKQELKLHCLMNNAGICIDGPFELMTYDSIRNMVDTNVTGAIMVSKEFLLRIIKDKGRILNVSSGMAKHPCARFSLYCATKATIKNFSDSLHQDLKPYGASCHSIIPGNLCLHGNLVLARTRNLQHCVSQLSQEERSMYAKSIDKATCLANAHIVYKLKDTPDDQVQKLAKIHNVQLPDLKTCPLFKDTEEYKKRSSLELAFRRFFKFMAGGYDIGTHLEDTYYMQGFEDSVRMVNPPRYIYAGNRFFHFFTGPFTDHMPRLALNWVNKLVGQQLEETDDS